MLQRLAASAWSTFVCCYSGAALNDHVLASFALRQETHSNVASEAVLEEVLCQSGRHVRAALIVHPVLTEQAGWREDTPDLIRDTVSH